jgi:hypothetical protein
MKRIEHEVVRHPGDRMELKAIFRDRFKRPASVSITTSTHETPTSRLVYQADAKEVTDTMFALAEIAWDMGWRPAGLGPTLAAVVDRFKIPKAE